MPHAAPDDAPMRPHTPPPPADWTYLSDQVMGGVSTGTARVAGSGAAAHLHLSGSVSTENRGGFIQTRARLDRPLPAKARALVIRVRGNGARYFVHLRTRDTARPWHYYQAGFDTTGDWRRLVLPFADFTPAARHLPGTPDPAAVTSVGFAAFGRDHRADLRARWLGVV